MERIKLFKMVRDIPYYISLSEDVQGYECVTKPTMLDKLLQTLGLKSRHMLCEFKWEDLDLPEELLKLPHEDPEIHRFLEVFIPETNKWIKVDPNWDSKIQHPGIPIAEWDGLNDTKLAVIPTKFYTVEESKKFIEQDIGDERNTYLLKNKDFFIAFNKWLDSKRRKD